MKIKKVVVGCIMLSMLIGASVTGAAADQSQGFKDVDTSHWGYSAITWGVQQKITSGYEDGTFKPNKTVTEEEFIALLVRAFGDVPSTGKEQHWSDPYYRIALDKNLPIADKRTATITRQSVANIIVGTQGVNFMGDDAVQYLLTNGLTKGKTAATIEGYKGKDTLTRAEAIAFIKNIMDKVENKTMLARPETPTPVSELPSPVTTTKSTKPKENESPVTPSVSMKVPLESIIASFNKAVKELGLSEDYLLVKETFTANTSSKTSTIYDYYAKSPVDGSLLDAFAFSVFYDSKTGDFQAIQGSVKVDLADKFIESILMAIYQDSEKGKQVFTSNKISEIIKKTHSDKSKVDDMILDDRLYLRYGPGVESPMILSPKDYFSIHI